MFLELAATSSIILASGAAIPVQADWCAPKSPPKIIVNLSATDPRGDYTKSMAALEKFHIDTQSPYAPGTETHVGGLTDGAIAVSQAVTMGGATRGDDNCLWYDTINVSIRLDQTVYVASDFPPGSCRFKSIWDHEHKHVRVDREILNAYQPVFDASVRAAAVQHARIGPVPKDQVPAAQVTLAAAIKQALADVAQRMEKDREIRQQAIDTHAEYERVQALCPE